MSRPATLLALCSILVLAACTPAAPKFDPATGEGFEGLLASFEAMKAEDQLAAVAASDEAVQRQLWVGSGVEEALGGAKPTDEVFTGLNAQLATTVDSVTAVDSPFVLPAVANGVDAEARGAGMFGGMLLSAFLTDAGLIATANGATGDATRDFGDGGTATMSAGKDGVVSTDFTVSTTYKGVTIQIRVGTQINPCPDADGVVEPKGHYEVNLTGPNGAGNSTVVDVTMDIQVNDDAGVAFSDFSYDASIMDRSQPPDQAIFDTSTSAMTFGLDADGQTHVDELSIAGYWNDSFQTDAFKMATFMAAWVAHHLEKAAEKAWQSGRCIDLRATTSDGPSHLEPNADVTITASPIAKSDGKPAGGTVTAELTAGGASVTPSATKVKAAAEFAYIAPNRRDKTGTVHLESRSKRGVGKTDVNLDTKSAAAYSATGGGGDWAAEGSTCDINAPWTVSGTGLTVTFSPLIGNAEDGSYVLGGEAGGVAWEGSGTYEIVFADDLTGVLTTHGTNTISTPLGPFTDEAVSTFVLTPQPPCS